MTGNALVQTVQDQAEKGEFDDLDEILGDFGRPENLHFWEDWDDGTLFVGMSESPDVLATITVDPQGEIDAEKVAPDEIRLSRLRTVSAPENRIEDRQFD